MSETISNEKGPTAGIGDSIGGNRSTRGWLFNPFRYVAGGKALGIGLIAILATSLIGSLSKTHFDGVIDMHTGLATAFWEFPLEGLIDWLCLAGVLWMAGKLISRSRFRFLDLLGTQALARWPFLVMSVAALLPGFRRYPAYLLWKFTGKGQQVVVGQLDWLVFAIVALAGLVILCWVVALMYKSFSVSCNVRGGKAIWTFVVAIFAAEIVSKILIVLLISAGGWI